MRIYTEVIIDKLLKALVATDEIIPEVSVSSSEVVSSEARPEVRTPLDTFIQWLPPRGSQRNSNDRSQELGIINFIFF